MTPATNPTNVYNRVAYLALAVVAVLGVTALVEGYDVKDVALLTAPGFTLAGIVVGRGQS